MNTLNYEIGVFLLTYIITYIKAIRAKLNIKNKFNKLNFNSNKPYSFLDLLNN